MSGGETVELRLHSEVNNSWEILDLDICDILLEKRGCTVNIVALDYLVCLNKCKHVFIGFIAIR